MLKRFMVWLALPVVALVLAACGGERDTPDPAGPAPTVAVTTQKVEAQPVTVEAARAAAQAEFDAYAAGDWVGAWELWTAAGKEAISRDEYARLHTECKTSAGMLFEITGARLESENKAVVTYKRMLVAGKADMRYEDGKWRYQPEPGAMADYAKGVDKVIAERRAEGRC